MVTRASYGARLKWFQYLDSRKVSRMLRTLTLSPKTGKSPLTGRVGFDNLVRGEVFGRLHALIPAQPGDESRVWGVNSFAALPAFGGKFGEEVAQQRGRRMPATSRKENGARSGL